MLRRCHTWPLWDFDIMKTLNGGTSFIAEVPTAKLILDTAGSKAYPALYKIYSSKSYPQKQITYDEPLSFHMR